jgi:hypothetical protein
VRIADLPGSILPHGDEVHRPYVADGAHVAGTLVRNPAVAVDPSRRERRIEDGRAAEKDLMVDPADGVAVAGVDPRPLAVVVVVEVQEERVAGREEPEGHAVAIVETVAGPGEQIPVAGFELRFLLVFFVRGGEQPQHDVEVTAPSGDEPVAPAVAALVIAENSRGAGPGVGEAQPEIDLGTGRLAGRHVHHAGRAVAVLGGESARQQIHPADGFRIDDAEEAVELFQVKRLEELLPVQLDQRLAGQAAANVELRRRAVARHARHDPDHAIEVVGEVRHAPDLLAVERHAGGGRVADQRVAGHDVDLAEGGDGKEPQGDFRNLAFDDLHRLLRHREPGEPRLDDMAPRADAGQGELPLRIGEHARSGAAEEDLGAGERSAFGIAHRAGHGGGVRRSAQAEADPKSRYENKDPSQHTLPGIVHVLLSPKLGRNDSRGAVDDSWMIRG